MAVGDIFLLRVQFRSAARVWTVNQHYADVDGQSDKTASTDLTDAYDSAYLLGIRTNLASDSTVEGLYCVKLTGGDAMPSSDNLGYQVGLETGNSLPPNSALVVSLGSTDTGLVRPGRLYVAGIPTAKVSGGNVTGAYLTQFKTTWEAIAGDVLVGNDGSWQPVIYSTILAGAERIPPVGFNVDSTRVKPILYSQRRRNSRQRGAAASPP